MIPCLTHEDEAILAAQFAFVRAERQHQRRAPLAFASRTGAPLPRLLALTALCDAIAAQLATLVTADARWVACVAEGRELAQSVALLVLERVARSGTGLTSAEVDSLRVGALRVQEVHGVDDPLVLLMAVEDGEGVVRWWPRAVPLPVTRGVPTRPLDPTSAGEEHA